MNADISFPADLESILKRIDLIQPMEYGSSRNYLDGAVTYLSPYISRGVISTKFVMDRLIERGYSIENAEKLFQELAWRDFWQKTWIANGNAIFDDLKNPQAECDFDWMPSAIENESTGIIAIDEGIKNLKSSGYMHNHLRMYVASLICNVAKTHWKIPSKWMYFHLLDGDLASNMLSWQWVAGTNSNKKYTANQQNVNKYCKTHQQGTYLDISYEELSTINYPNVLKERQEIELETVLPKSDDLKVNEEVPVLLYNYYNLDPYWRSDETVNRILILEPSIFNEFPVSQKCMDFCIDLSKNIEGIQCFLGEFDQLKEEYSKAQFIFKEHPLNNYEGVEDARHWMFPRAVVKPSFFSYWKSCVKGLKIS